MSPVNKILSVFLIVIALIIGVGLILPSKMHVERQITINTKPKEVFALVSSFQDWDSWSPWAQIDPEAEMTITGSGVGQKMTWVSDNPNVGQGSQEIIQLKFPRYLKTHLEFGDRGVADAIFNLTPIR